MLSELDFAQGFWKRAGEANTGSDVSRFESKVSFAANLGIVPASDDPSLDVSVWLADIEGWETRNSCDWPRW
jgi:hypothetical protein